jgi:glycine hydroxymethyltransferase
MTMRGFDEDDFRDVGRIICAALGPKPDLSALANRSAALLDRHPLYPGLAAFPTFGA